MKVLFVLGLQDKVKMGFEGAVVGVMVMMGMVMAIGGVLSGAVVVWDQIIMLVEGFADEE